MEKILSVKDKLELRMQEIRRPIRFSETPVLKPILSIFLLVVLFSSLGLVVGGYALVGSIIAAISSFSLAFSAKLETVRQKPVEGEEVGEGSDLEKEKLTILHQIATLEEEFENLEEIEEEILKRRNEESSPDATKN